MRYIENEYIYILIFNAINKIMLITRKMITQNNMRKIII